MRALNIIVIAALFTVIAACVPPSGDGTGAAGEPFVGGNAGLNLYLQNGLPPPTIFDGGSNPFAIGIVLENIGESDVGPGSDNPFLQVRLEGLLPSNFDITDSDLVQMPNVPLRGAKKNFDGTILPGEVNHVIYSPLNFMPELPGNQVHTFRVVACYDYTSYATFLLCMKNDMLENVQDSTICTMSGEKAVANSGGPIHVTKVVQNPLDAHKVQVNFVMEHVGTGEFYGRPEYGAAAGGEEYCDPSVRNLNKYNVHVAVSSDDPNAQVTCYRLDGGSDQGVLTMYMGSPQTMTCIVEGSQSTARVYQSSMNVKLSYRYGEFIEDQFIVHAVPN